MTTTSVRAAIREQLDPVIAEIVTREISRRGSASAQQSAVAPTLMSLLLASQRTVQGQQPFAALAPILISTLLTQQQQPVQRRQPLGALAPFLVAALSGAR